MNSSYNVTIESKLRLLYFDLKWLDFLLKAFQVFSSINLTNHPNIEIIHVHISAAKKWYQKASSLLLNNTSLIGGTLSSDIDTSIESLLAKNFSYGTTLLDHLEKTCNRVGQPFLLNALTKIEACYDDVLLLTNREGAPSPEKKTQFETLLKTTLEKFKINEQMLHEFLQIHYKNACRIEQRILFLQYWSQHMDHEIGKMIRMDRFRRLLKIHVLLTRGKADYALEKYRWMRTHVEFVQQNLARKLQPHISKEVFIQQLEAEKKRLEKQVQQQEKEYTQCTSLEKNLLHIIRLWTDNSYYEFSANYFSSLEALTNTGFFVNYPIFSRSLTNTQVEIFSVLGSALLYKIDSKIGEWLSGGIMQFPAGLLTACSSLIMAQVPHYWIALSQQLKNEEALAAWFPAVHLMAELGLILATHTLFGDINAELLAFLAIGYLIGRGCQYISRQLFNYLQPNEPTTRSATALLYSILERSVSSMSNRIGRFYLAPKLYLLGMTFFKTPTSDALLSNSQYCQRYAEECEAVALARLKLRESTSMEEIQHTWRQQMRIHHPDHQGELRDAQALNNAYERLKELSETKNTRYSRGRVAFN